MNRTQLAELDADVERSIERPEVSRSAVRLEQDERLAEQEAERAIQEERRRALDRAGAWLIGRVADQRGRVLEVISAEGRVWVKGQSTLTPGIITVLDPGPAQGLADALERGHGRVPTATGRFLQVVTIATGFQIRDPAMEGSWGLLVQLSKIEAGRMVDDLRRAAK